MRPSVFSIVVLVFLAARAFAAAPATQEAPADSDVLKLSPDDTIILEGGGSSGSALQHYLLQYYVSSEAAAKFPAQGSADRAASPQFALLHDSPNLKLPPGRKIIALGNTRFLSAEDRRRLDENPGAILLRRMPDGVIAAGDQNEAVATFLDRVAGIRFYAPDEIWTSRPRSSHIEIGDLNLFRPRLFATNWFAPYWRRNREWVQMNPGAGRLTITAYHNLANVFPPDK